MCPPLSELSSSRVDQRADEGVGQAPARSASCTTHGPTILILEDSDALRRATEATVADMHLFERILTASNGLEGYKRARRTPVDIILCDLGMPLCDGAGFLRLQQQDARLRDVPVLMLTGASDSRSVADCLAMGAVDYVRKPAEAIELRARLSVHLRLRQVQERLRERTLELEAITRIDALTRVANRRHFDDQAALELARAARYGRSLSLLMIDIDHFKRVNDTYGHQAGDAVLQRAGHTLQVAVRQSDTVARYGGEEFAVLLPETPLAAAAEVAERLRSKLAALSVSSGGRTLDVTASVGVASRSSTDSGDIADLVAAADQALYRAKASGRNRVVVADA